MRRWLTLAGRAAGVIRRATSQEPEAAVPRAQAPAAPATSGSALGYAPVDDDRADPGEVVWAWVPFEENARQGKDRPVLVVGRDGDTLLALQLTSQDHDRDEAQEAAAGRFWIDIGSGAWDHRRRPSEARVNRLIRLDREAVRRTGARLDRDIFEQVVAQVREHYPDV